MKTIWKYEMTRTQKVLMQKDAKILSVGSQDSRIMIWAEVDDNEEKEERCFEVIGTGWPVHTRGDFIGTVFCENGLVWHIYENNKA